MANEKLSWTQRRLLTLLAMPAFGVALAYTMVTTYLPVLIDRLSGPAVTGILIAGEGLFALFLPIVMGQWSDYLRTRLGGRVPFMFAATALAVPALVVMPLGSGSLIVIGASLTVFFVAYFVYYSPYYALFPDMVPEAMRGRSQGAQGALRSAGMLLALVGGGLLLELWQPLPFLVGAIALAGVTAFFFYGVRDRLGRGEEGAAEQGQTNWAANWELVRDNPSIRFWVIANSLWEASLGALRAFVVLYLTRGLGFSLSGVSGALALVGVAALVAAPLSGKLGDRFGHRPVMLAALCVFAVGMLPTLFTTNEYWLVAILPVAFAAVTLMTLPYSVLMGLLPSEEYHGAGAALFGFSRGLGILIGPLLAGIAVESLKGVELFTFAETTGYVAMFPVASALLLASTPFLLKINPDGRQEA